MSRFIKMFAVAAALLGGLATPVFAQTPTRSGSTQQRVDVYRAICQKLESDFPRLKIANYKILQPATKTYNCIGWALGTMTEWVWPGRSVEDFDTLTASFGYQRLNTLDVRVQNGVRKIVLYGKIENGQLTTTHMAKQMPDGTWTSKCGQLPLIQHQHPSDLNGAAYGKPIAVYARAIK